MAELAVVRVVVGAWLVAVFASTVAQLTSAVLPRWVKVDIDVDGRVDELDVGLWQTCRSYEFTYNCTTLNSSSLTACSALTLCVLVVRSDCWRVRPHTIIHVALSVLLLAAGRHVWVWSGLLQLAGVIVCGVNLSYGLPVSIDSCPLITQPLTSPVASLPLSTTQCHARTASAYVIAAVGAGLAVTSGLMGVAMSRDPNGDDDEPLLDGVADFVASQPIDNRATV